MNGKGENRMKFPTYEEMGQEVANIVLDEYEYKGKTLRQWIEIISATELGTNLAEVGTDLISRQQAIDALRAMQTYKLFAGDDMLLIDQAGAQTELMLLPPIQPKRGKWIHHPEIGWGETWLCDQCGEKTTSTVMGKPRANFCPMCGADMREVSKQ